MLPPTTPARQDGVAQEYFYAFDQTGGHSGPGIKSFVRGGVEAIENTNVSFVPRYTVELAKSAGREGVGYFGSPYPSGRSLRSRSRVRRTRVNLGPAYKIQCTYGKTFTRKSPGTRLNPHKDGYGNRCYGRVGIRVW